MAIRAGIIGRPAAATFAPVKAAPKAPKTTPTATSAASASAPGRVHQPCKLPFSFFRVVLGKGELAVLPPLILAERLRLCLKRVGDPEQDR